ncbi:M23 family metallopeptidase [Glaciihabitans sp. GrIS 2.15]|uniref:M23 family metallopeptidase n=1 Tax=Glaciihabitans sp. GrIS 2.15 TaxID=3071710 RepID=UPI002DFFC5B3|nr:murein DD-endopeptidase MepM/ murein hydrolase activator NlpD [Glaciihabitans sp. GrIS 2.15]
MTDDIGLPSARSRRELAERRASTPRLRTRRARTVAVAIRPAAPLRRNRFRRVLRKLMTVGAMAGAGALLISTSLPASAFLNSSGVSSASATTTSASAGVPVQNLRVDANAAVAAPPRDAYTVVSLVQQIATKYASAARSTAYTNDPNGTIQWPFPVPVPIASGFGPRQVEGCGFCSTFHEGVDFTPGSGVPIQAIANGVVSKVEFDGGGLGNNVTIDHNINGQKVQSIYGHMLAGSVRMVVGQMVKVSDQVGQVGSSGASTGAHLHLEIHLNNTPVDPFAWLKANAN